MWAYRYLKGGAPLDRCPDCGRDLAAAGGVDVALSVGGRVFDVPTRLADGWLVDTDDGAVTAGFHSTTCCGGCGAQLFDLDGVVEETYRDNESEYVV